MKLQYIAIGLIFVTALFADSIMEHFAFVPACIILGIPVVIAGVLVWVSDKWA